MYKEHEKIFQQVARDTGFWIFVRFTNKESIRYVKLDGYVPKRIDCKAKTAGFNSRKGPWQLAGLVVDYRIHSDVFKPGKSVDAEKKWGEFEKGVLKAAGSGYRVDTNAASKHYGCVMLNGMYVYSDYDLWDIVDPGNPRRNFAVVEELHGQPHFRNYLQRKVEECLKKTSLAQMVQHSGEEQNPSTAAPSDQPLDAFGPNGEVVTLMNLDVWRAWRRDKFQGRLSLRERY